MTAPTHAAFGILWAAAVGAPTIHAVAAAIGALLPDLDHPQSSMGRLFFFVSYPLNDRFGHRQLIHSFLIWTPLIFIGLVKSKIILWIGLGAWSHILIDCYNVTGVKALLPMTERQVVCFRRDWRIVTGSVAEIMVFIVLASCVGATHYAHALGGPRKLINLLVRSPRIMAEEYERAGQKICRVEGRFRWANGTIDAVTWLVVGTQKNRLVFWDGSKLIHPQHGKFLSAGLRETETPWPGVQITGLCRTSAPSFWLSGGVWRYADTGKLVAGTVKRVDGRAPEILIEKITLESIIPSKAADPERQAPAPSDQAGERPGEWFGR